MPACHVQGCGREALPKLPICGPCRLSYLNGVMDGASGKKVDTTPCPACGHFVHHRTACRWHGGSCSDAQADPTLWCKCDGKHPRGTMSVQRFLFVGERRSNRAKKLGVTWEDGALAAKPLFEALQATGIDLRNVGFTNLFERGGRRTVSKAVLRGAKIVAMGSKVHRALESNGVPHIHIIHPAARGYIRRRETYVEHVRERLAPILEGAA